MIYAIKQKAERILGPAYHNLKHTGTKRRCPLCERRARKFLAAGIVPRADAECPFCAARERHRLFWLFLSRRTDFFEKPPAKMLHVAPEAVFKKKFRAMLDSGYVTADLYAADVDVNMDITAINYPDESFDFIYCSHVLEHVPDDKKAIREFLRVLKPSGIAILLVPINANETFEDPTIEDPQERLRLFGQDDHVRRYGPDYEDRLRKQGFQVKRIGPSDFLGAEEIERNGITPASGDIFYCTKH